MRDVSLGAPVSAERSIPPEASIREQLERVLASRQFSAAEGARKFLRFVVEEALAGRADRLKEYTLAVEVLGRPESFDTKTNPAVRVEAGRLRQRLEHYYLTQGREDPVLIELPRGGYVPAFGNNNDVLHLHEHLAEARAARSGGPVPEPITASLPGGPAIAVLPFESVGGPADARFADGITIEILTALSQFHEFQVLGRNTVFRHRGETDAVRLRNELGARYVLTGTVQRSDSLVRVHAELLSGADGKVLWAERYERDLSAQAIFDVQDDIATQVVATVAQPHGVIARPESVLARRKPPDRIDSYDCLLLFYEYTAHPSVDGHRNLRTVLEAETREAPEVSSLWSALSMVHNDTWRFGFNVQESREAARERALEAAQKAVRLDPWNALGYHARFLAHFAHGDLAAFREAGDRAVELNPNHSDILADYGLHLTMCDDWLVGQLFLKVALSLNPEPPDWYWFPFFLWHYEQGEYDAALDMALHSQNQEFFWTHGMHALAYSALGMLDQAAAAVARLLAAYPEFPSQAREELARWVSPERAERIITGLRAAGMAIPNAG